MPSPFLAGLIQGLAGSVGKKITEGKENAALSGLAQLSPSDPEYSNQMMNLFRQNPQMASLAMQMRQMQQPTFEKVAAGEGYGTLDKQTGKFNLQGTIPNKPTARTATWTLADESTSGGKPLQQKYGNSTNLLYTSTDPATGKQVFEYKPQGTTTDQSAKQGTVLENSYKFHTGLVQKLAQPFEDRMRRMDNLQTSLDQKSPQADALIAPELLTAMAGGQGSGLRMNEAEISRIVGGRNAWLGLKATLMRYQSNPDKPFLIPDEQRAQIQKLVDATKGRYSSQSDLINQAQSDLVTAKSNAEHKQIYARLKQALSGSGKGQDSARYSVNGKIYNIPTNELKDFLKEFPNAAKQ